MKLPFSDCMAQNMPCGIYLRRKAPDFVLEYPTPLSKSACQWISWVEQQRGIRIQHVRNGGEVRIGPRRIPVDGLFE